MARTIIYSSSIHLFSIFPCDSHHHLFVLYSSSIRLYVALVPPLEEASESWVCVRGKVFFVISLSARAARTVICSSFVRHLFVICSSFVRHLFVICSSFVRHLFVICSSFHYLPVVLRLLVRLTPFSLKKVSEKL